MSNMELVSATPALDGYHFGDDGAIPNHPTLPLLLYQRVLTLPAQEPARACIALFATNGWGGSWRNGIYGYHHYHSTAHEVLAICSGEAQVHLGGETGSVLQVGAGDVVIIPAGVGHKNLGASPDFLVVGAYPPGQQPDLCYGRATERPQNLKNIAAVPLPTTDPLYGPAGPLLAWWDPAQQ
jgi:uncharacterized protein YjlB